jgi:hypothetical protein
LQEFCKTLLRRSRKARKPLEKRREKPTREATRGVVFEPSMRYMIPDPN